MPTRYDHARGIWTVSDFLTADECTSWIERVEAAGFDEATITTARGFVMNKSVRDNDRVMIDDPDAAATLWERAKPFVGADATVQGTAVGLNERLRFYRYTDGQKFDWHSDGHFARPDGSEVSRLTFMIYLNDEFGGGETKFEIGRELVVVTPMTGTALFFVHRLRHQGAPVTIGTKYVLRSDVMYTRPPASE
ncbi:MAG: prolyl hydroxylase family protein [Planctomycetota bacterium]